MPRKGRAGFTIIELLVAIAIVAILAGILFPVVSASIRKAKEARCYSNLKQIGAAIQMYRSYYNDRLPQRLSDLYPTFIEEPELLVCPLDGHHGQIAGTDRLEGNQYVSTGVSYTWTLSWAKAIEWGWWDPWPRHGPGRWWGQTPLVECHWHWATKFNPEWEEDQAKPKRGGNAVVLTLDGSLHMFPGAVNIRDWTPE